MRKQCARAVLSVSLSFFPFSRPSIVLPQVELNNTRKPNIQKKGEEGKVMIKSVVSVAVDLRHDSPLLIGLSM